jgi:hypothetical protein
MMDIAPGRSSVRVAEHGGNRGLGVTHVRGH